MGYTIEIDDQQIRPDGSIYRGVRLFRNKKLAARADVYPKGGYFAASWDTKADSDRIVNEFEKALTAISDKLAGGIEKLDGQTYFPERYHQIQNSLIYTALGLTAKVETGWTQPLTFRQVVDDAIGRGLTQPKITFARFNTLAGDFAITPLVSNMGFITHFRDTVAYSIMGANLTDIPKENFEEMFDIVRYLFALHQNSSSHA